MTSDIADLRFVITGAGGGIGQSIAARAAELGGLVTIADSDARAGEEAAATIRDAGGDARFLRCDVSSEPEVKRLMGAAAEWMGGMDVLVNNAAISERSVGTSTDLDSLSYEKFLRVLQVDIGGPWLGAKHARPYLRESDHACILNAGSMASFLGYPELHAYGAAKGGVLLLTRSLAAELAPDGIRVNCYCPGNIMTPMLDTAFASAADPAAVRSARLATHLVRRFGTPDDIAHLVCFLAGREASYITGQSFVSDGGTLAWRGTVADLPFTNS